MKLHMILHESFEAPGAIEIWAKENGHTLTFTHIYNRDTLPSEFDFDFLIIGGGPQSPDTTLEECPYFNAKNEIAFIRDAIAKDKIVLGICLGAQLIGESYNARYEHSPHKEIGVFPIAMTEEANH